MTILILAMLLSGCVTTGTQELIREMDATDCQGWRVSVMEHRVEAECW